MTWGWGSPFWPPIIIKCAGIQLSKRLYQPTRRLLQGDHRCSNNRIAQLKRERGPDEGAKGVGGEKGERGWVFAAGLPLHHHHHSPNSHYPPSLVSLLPSWACREKGEREGHPLHPPTHSISTSD